MLIQWKKRKGTSVGPHGHTRRFSKVFLPYKLVLCDINPKVCILDNESSKML